MGMRYILSLLCVFAAISCAARQDGNLRNDIAQIIANKRATVGVALIVGGKDTLTVNNEFHYPTQSVYKFHLALAVLDYMDKNDITLSHQLLINKEELLPNTHSPIRDEHPEGNCYMSIGDIIKYTVSKSDNNGCDILFRFIGGPSAVDKYIRDQGMTEFAIAATEQEMHSGWDVQYTNWSTPYTAACVLETFRTKEILPKEFHDFLWQSMLETSTGANKIVAQLPQGTVVGHKTGASYRNDEGLNAAENDIAIIQLPDGRYYSLVVFVANSMEDQETNCKIIADISKVVYDYLVAKQN